MREVQAIIQGAVDGWCLVVTASDTYNVHHDFDDVLSVWRMVQ